MQEKIPNELIYKSEAVSVAITILKSLPTEATRVKNALEEMPPVQQRGIILDMKMPRSCKECGFRINRSRDSWRCALHKVYRGGAAYIPKGIYPDADRERPSCCPLDKGRWIDDE